MLRHLLAWTQDAFDLLVVALLFAALFMRGADGGALASLFAAILLGLLAVRVILSQPEALSHAFQNQVGILVLGSAYVGWALISLAPFGSSEAANAAELAAGHQRWSISPYRTLEGLASFAAIAGAYIHGLLAVRSTRCSQRLLIYVAAGATALTLGALLRFSGEAHADPRWPGRLLAGFASPNVAADAFAILAIFSAACAIQVATALTSKQASKLALSELGRGALGIAAFILCWACLFLTASRGGLVAATIGLAGFGFLLWSNSSKRKSTRAGLLLFGLIGALGAFASDYALRRFGAHGADLQLRETMLNAHWQAFLERPLNGFGLNSFHEINSLAQSQENWNALANIGAAHNIYIQALEESGIVGFVLLGALLMVPLARNVSHTLGGDRRGRTWCAATIGAAIVLLVHGWIDFGMQTPALAALLAFSLGAYPKPQQPNRRRLRRDDELDLETPLEGAVTL